MSVREYIGARYVPIFGRKDEESIIWDNTKPYEPLTIVLYEGNSYTSRQYVPVGIDIHNNEFWANTGNYNSQVEQYRQEVQGFTDRLDEVEETANEANEAVQAESTRAEAAEDALETRIDANETAISNETTRARGSENDLRNDLDEEVERATAAEGMLASQVNDLKSWREWEKRIENIHNARTCGTINYALDWNTDYCEPSTWAGSEWNIPTLTYNPRSGYIEIHGTLRIKQDMDWHVPLGQFQIAGGSNLTFMSACLRTYEDSSHVVHHYGSNLRIYGTNSTSTVQVKLASNGGVETTETNAGMLTSSKNLSAGEIITINGFQQITYPQGGMLLDFVSRELAREAADIYAGWSRTAEYKQDIYEMTHSWNSSKTQPTASQCAASVWCAYKVAAMRRGQKFTYVPNGSTAWSFGDVIAHAYPDEEMNFQDCQKGDIMLFMTHKRVMYHTAILVTDYRASSRDCKVMQFGVTNSMTNPNPQTLGTNTAEGPRTYHIESERFIIRPWRE